MTVDELIEIGAGHAINEFTGDIMRIIPCGDGSVELEHIHTTDEDLPADKLCGLLFDEDTVNSSWSPMSTRDATTRYSEVLREGRLIRTVGSTYIR